MQSKELFESNQHLVEIIAKSFSGYLNGEETAITIDDLRSEAMIGLHQASESFDKKKGVTFQTYASRCAANAISNFLFANRTTIRHPRKVILGYQKVKRLLEEQETSIDELILTKQITTTEMDNYICFTTVNNKQDDYHPIDEAEPESEEMAELEAAIQQLNPIQQLIIKMSFGIGNHKKMTLEEIGEELKIGDEMKDKKMTVSQRKSTILKKLKLMMSGANQK